MPLYHSFNLKDPLGLGGVCTGLPNTLTSGAQAGTQNRHYANKFISGGAITQFALRVGTSSGNFILSVYDNTGTSGAPGTRLWTSGSTAVGTGGAVQTVSIGSTLTIDPNVHWLAFIVDNSTATFSSHNGLAIAPWAGIKTCGYRDPGSFAAADPFGTFSFGTLVNFCIVGS